jgi:hypothetical protein
MSQKNVVCGQEIKQLIAQGEPVVIHEGYALNISTWIDNHPGGRLAILHMVGRDATDEINMYAIFRFLGRRTSLPNPGVKLMPHTIATIPTKPF